MATDTPLPFTPAANASWVTSVSDALGGIDACDNPHPPGYRDCHARPGRECIAGIVCPDCDDEPGTLMPQAIAEVNALFCQPKTQPQGGKSRVDDVRVPFPPPEPAGIWKEWSGDWNAACDDVERELTRMLRGMSRLRAAGSAAGFAACIGSTSERDMHRLAVAAWGVLLSDSVAYHIAREEMRSLYQFHGDRIDLARMAEEARTYHRRHVAGGAQ